MNIISGFSFKLSSELLGLTTKEIRICDLIRQGKTSKEISKIERVSRKTVETHRQNIRKKLGISNTRTNLHSYLLSIS